MKNLYLSISIIAGICLVALLLGTITTSVSGNVDLVILEGDITFSDANITVGTPVNINATVRNNGTDNALGVFMNFYDNETRIGTELTLNLGGGDNKTLGVQWIPATAGNHTIRVNATPYLGETNKTNNEANKTVYVRSGTLNVTAYASPTNPFPSTQFWVNGSVKYLLFQGISDFPTNNATVTIRIEGINTTYTTVTDADGAYSKQITAPPSLGQQILNVTATKGDNYEGNTTTSILVQAPDLTVKEITFSNEKPSAGDVVKINATIGNVGNMNATNITVRFYVDDKMLPVGSIISSLLANSSIAVETEWTAEVGEHKIKVVVDPDNTTAEANNGNNEREKTISVERKSGFWIPGFEIIAIIVAICIIGTVCSHKKRTN
jgi:subtilase family serine protease